MTRDLLRRCGILHTSAPNSHGEATLLSLEELCSFTHRPPGDILALRVPRRPFAPLIRGNVNDCYMRRIPHDTPALQLLTGYINNAQNGDGIVGARAAALAPNLE